MGAEAVIPPLSLCVVMTPSANAEMRRLVAPETASWQFSQRRNGCTRKAISLREQWSTGE